MSSTSKLEMSLDEIIKAQKGKGGQAQGNKKAGGFIGRKSATNNRGRQFASPKSKRQVGGGFKRQTRVNLKRTTQKGRPLNVTPKRIVGGRKPVGTRFGGVRKNVAGNRAMIAATKNLVKKLVKNAIARNVVGPSRGKVVRIPANRLRQRTIVLNKISPKSRVIARRRVLPVQNTVLVRQQQPRVRGRGPVQFGGPMVQQRAQRVITIPKRRNIQYLQQQQQPVVLQQRSRNFGGNTSQASGSSVRDQINALRRANRLQQLQTQFINQQQPRQQFIQVPQQKPIIIRQQRQPRRQQQQVIVQQRPQRRPQQKQQQYILLQPQQPRRQQQQFVAVKQQFVRRQPFHGQRRQQIVQLGAIIDPPNFLQRI